MRVFIAEKPELGRAIVEALGQGQRRDGYIEVGNDRVTWCFGHMLTLCTPEDYDANHKRWVMADLPIINRPWKKKVGPDKDKQLGVIKELLREATEVIHAGDPDDEGQLLVDEVLAYARCRAPVKRLLINDNNVAVVRRALGAMRPNGEFAGLSAAAEARAVADQMYGFNMTRAYTLAARAKGAEGIWSVGRVQTPILGLVVRRDRAHAGHVPVYYWEIAGTFTCENLSFGALYMVAPGDPIDEEKRLADGNFAEKVAAECRGQPAKIEKAVTRKRKESPPLPYNLLKLQMDAARKWGYAPDVVKDVTQALREKHRLITYNRSDCEYLSDEQHADAASVLGAIAGNAPVLAAAAHRGNPGLKSRAFDSSKVTAHHAIIPTAAGGNLSALSEAEQRIYLLVARAYIAQFFPEHEFDQTEVVVLVKDKYRFGCRSRVTTNPGWKALYRNDGEDDEPEDGDAQLDLRALSGGGNGRCTDAKVERRATKPPPLYTMATLLKDLTRVSKYVRDPRLRDVLVAKDAAKAGEHGGIGTPATRDAIVKTLFSRGFLEEKRKSVVSTKAGADFYDGLPDDARYPDMTAVWHEQQEAIRQGQLTVEAFIDGLATYVGNEVARVKGGGVALNIEAPKCPKCGRALRRIKGTKGTFWGCTGYQEGCTFTADDEKGKPVCDGSGKTKPDSKGFACPECGKPLQRRTGTKGAFWSCTGYREGCRFSVDDVKGKPKSKPRGAAMKGGAK